MTEVSRERLISRLAESASNSAHYVWLISDDLSYFESHDGWLFAYKKALGYVIGAVEPLAPANLDRTQYTDPSFNRAMNEFMEKMGSDRILFTSVGQDFAEAAAKSGFRSLKIGEEPWITLANYQPRGNSGKGLRSARNQALRAGLKVVEWSGPEVTSTHRPAIQKLYRAWENNTLWTLNGFLFRLDPFFPIPGRRYFAALSSNRIEAFLVATPIVQGESYYFEDLVYPIDLINGATELVTLEALRILQESENKKVSLGIVMLNAISTSPHFSPTCFSQTELSLAAAALKIFYNSEGIELHRKRYKPSGWTNVYNTLCHQSGSGTSLAGRMHWIWGCIAAIEVCLPRPNLRLGALKSAFLSPLLRRPVSSIWTISLIFSFLLINKGGTLPWLAFKTFAFQGSAPFWTWIPCSVTNELLMKTPIQFWLALIVSVFLFPFLERRLGSRRLTAIILLLFPAIEILAETLLARPFYVIHVHPIEALVTDSDTGCWPLIIVLTGVALSQFKRFREIVLIVASLSSLTLAILFVKHIHNAALGLRYFFFLMVGLGVARGIRWWQSAKDRRLAAKS